MLSVFFMNGKNSTVFICSQSRPTPKKLDSFK